CNIGFEAVDTLAEREEALDLFADPPIVDYLELHEFANTSANTAQILIFNDLLEIDTNDDDFPDQTEALAIFHAESCAPGPVTVRVRIDRDEDETGEELDDLEATATITVVGPVRFITVTASPTQVICGEKSEIRVSATDELNHGVSDHTLVEVITNYGGVLAGTGSSLTTNQPVNPLSSTAVEIIDGVGKAFLLTSDAHVGPYEVLAASALNPLGPGINERIPVVAQVTVTCTKGVPTTPVTAPNTGTGTSTGAIRPPNTGDAGLLDNSGHGSPWAVVVAAALSSALLGLAGLRLARR
ncbi:MAG TPA: hypothetical protein VG845_07755, partial [Dehalococcoidia bacterium]|nr:hypothetical protein [Dehalococcoidia bacterium]